MGKGRKPKPPIVRILEGTRAHGGVKGVDMARIAEGVPDAPPHLDGIALEHWHYLAGHLGRAKLLELVDLGQLANACIAYAQIIAAKEHIAAHGITLLDLKTDSIKKNPACSVLSDSMARYHSIASEFGLTPSSRAKLRMPTPDKEVDDFDAFVKQA